MPAANTTRVLGGLIVLIGSTSGAAAQEWAEKMFDESSHDFGVVARGSDVRHRFKVHNRYAHTVHISNVQSTCGCSAATPTKYTLAPGETAWVEVTMDTRRFTREKDSNLIVTFDQPQYAQVRIPVKVYIRTDVVLTPGAANFGAVERGKAAELKLEIAYAGRDDWKIREVKIKNEHLEGKVEETARGGGRVSYRLLLNLKPTAPPGTLREQIMLVTDDSGSPYVPVLVEASVEADVAITVAPLGTLVPGRTKTFNVVLRGRKPFAIEKIECESKQGLFKVRLSKDPRPVHVLPISFVPPEKPGPFAEKFTVTISGRPEPVTFEAAGRITQLADGS